MKILAARGHNGRSRTMSEVVRKGEVVRRRGRQDGPRTAVPCVPPLKNGGESGLVYRNSLPVGHDAGPTGAAHGTGYGGTVQALASSLWPVANQQRGI